MAQLGNCGEDFGVLRWRLADWYQDHSITWFQQLRPKCCKLVHWLLQNWRFQGGALWFRWDLRANWLRQLARGLSREVWHQLQVRRLCHDYGGSKSTAMWQELQNHQLYRSLGLWGAEMQRTCDLYAMGCSSTYISINGASSRKAYVSGVCTSPSTAAPAAPSTTTPLEPTWGDYTAIIIAEGRIEVLMGLVMLLGHVGAGKYSAGMFDIGREAVKCHWSVLWLVGRGICWLPYLHQLAAVSAQLNCHCFQIMLNFLAYEHV